MDSLSSLQKTKSRKMKKLMKKSRVQIILDLFFRAIEIIVVLVTLAKLSYELVIMFEDSGVVEIILANRNLAFVVGNAIVITLIVESGLLLNQELDPKCKSNDLYDEFVLESSRRDTTSRAEQSITKTRVKQSEEDKEKQSVTEKKTKQSVTEKKAKQSKPKKMNEEIISVKKEKQSIVEHQNITVEKMEKQSLSYRRSGSEKLKGLEKSSLLRRSETDVSSERFDSDDELRYKIESFIARQRRNQNDD